MSSNPIAIIEINGRKDYVFLRQSDLQNNYPIGSSVKVIGKGGIEIASKLPGVSLLTVQENIQLNKYFEG